MFTANTWERCINFKTQSKWIVEFKSTFYADQSIESRASDLLWAQTIMQTCTSEVTLSFHRKLSSLFISIPTGMTNPVLTLEGMPDIDQQEVVVGNYYANCDINYSNKLSYAALCYVSDKNENGKAIGISSINGNNYQLIRFASIPLTGVYTALKVSSTQFQLIVPPVAINANAKLVLRDGTKKYELLLSDKSFFN